jgi:HEAT repeat protein
MLFYHGDGKMKNKSKKPNTRKANHITLLAVPALIGYMLLCFGCGESLQSPRLERPTPVSANTLLPLANQIIREALIDANPLIRANAIEVVANTKQVRLIPKVQRLLKDEYIPVRFAAVLAVGDLEYALGRRSLTMLLKDKNENIRIGALYALSKLGSTENIEQIRKAIASNDQTVRANAALLLGKSGDKNPLTRQALWWTLRREDSGPKVRFQTAEAIAMTGDERVYPKLWTMLISAYADDRVMGIKAMGALGTLQARDALTTMLDDKVVEVRLAAAEQLGAFKEPFAERVVLEVFRKNLAAGLDKQSRERLNVRTALAIGKIGTPSLTGYLPRFLRDESKSVRIAAAMAVFQCNMKN